MNSETLILNCIFAKTYSLLPLCSTAKLLLVFNKLMRPSVSDNPEAAAQGNKLLSFTSDQWFRSGSSLPVLEEMENAHNKST